MMLRVNPLTLIGAALIVLGFVAFAYRGIPYTTNPAAVVDAGAIPAGAAGRKIVPMSPLWIGLVLAGGGALIGVGSRKAS
jgi:hypothetical protein